MATVKQENENQSAAPTLGMSSGIIGQGVIPGQGREVSSRQKGSGRFTNLQSYIRANEPESGGLNPNARLIQQRAEQAGTQLGQRQTEFTNALEPIRTGLEGIQEQASVAQSAFQDPTRFVQSPENLKRFTAFRTGQEKIPGVTETYGQIEPLRQGLTSQQRQIAEGLRTDVGKNLQEYIRSQRSNPALATLGETQLDRFLTEQTPSGLSAIESAVSRAGQIESEQTPAQERLTQLESLRSQLAENPLVTQSGILNKLGEIYRPEEQYLTSGINKQEVYRLSGINPNEIEQTESLINEFGTAQSEYNRRLAEVNRLNNELRSSLYYEFNPNTQERPQQFGTRFIGVPELPGVDLNQFIGMGTKPAMTWQQALAAYLWSQAQGQAQGQTQPQNNEPTPEQLAAIDFKNREAFQKLLNERNANIEAANRLVERGSQIAQNPLAQKYKTFEQYYNPQTTRAQLLSSLDPTRLARIQAIGQLSGRENEIENILSGRIT